VKFSQEELNDVIQMISGKTDGPVNFDVQALAAVYNPNYIAASVGVMNYTIMLQGGDPIGHGTSPASYAHARSEMLATSDFTMVVTNNLTQVALKSKGHVNVTTVGSAHAVTFGFLPVRVGIVCDVVADIFALFTSPKDVVVSKRCSYHFGLFE
jgi:hypothetical protein